jgi:hypothetical protein
VYTCGEDVVFQAWERCGYLKAAWDTSFAARYLLRCDLNEMAGLNNLVSIWLDSFDLSLKLP